MLKGQTVYIVEGQYEMCSSVIGVFESKEEAETFVDECEKFDGDADYDSDSWTQNHPSGLEECCGFDFYIIAEHIIK